MRLTAIPLALLLACLPAGPSPASPQAPSAPAGGFCVGLYADEARTLNCVAGPAGTPFQLHVWAFIPPDSGGARYLTLRFHFPPELAFTARPAFNEKIFQVTVSPYPQDTVEWEMLVADCPGGWFLALTQPGAIAGPGPAVVTILEAYSMVRDCTFELHPVTLLDYVALNDPACAPTAVEGQTWGTIKGLYR